MRPIKLICVSALAAAGLSACASTGYGDRYSYRDECVRDRANDRAAAAVVGAGVGALAGSAVAGNSSNTAGTVAGGVAGAVIGSQLAKGRPCPSDYYR